MSRRLATVVLALLVAILGAGPGRSVASAGPTVIPWVVQPVERAGPWTELDAVACPAPGVCFAVGSGGTFRRFVPLTERWNGRAFRVGRTPSIVGAALNAVVCPAADQCLAVGQAGEPTASPLAVAWRGGAAWTRLAVANRSTGGTAACSRAWPASRCRPAGRSA